MKRVMQILLAVIFLGITACTGIPSQADQAKEIQVFEAWVRPATKGSNTAAYMRLVNQGKQADRLISAACQQARAVELHESMAHGDMMSMRPVAGIEVPAAAEVSLQPGGLHVMLIDLQQDLVSGSTVNLVLTFERFGQLTIVAPVEAR